MFQGYPPNLLWIFLIRLKFAEHEKMMHLPLATIASHWDSQWALLLLASPTNWGSEAWLWKENQSSHNNRELDGCCKRLCKFHAVKTRSLNRNIAFNAELCLCRGCRKKARQARADASGKGSNWADGLRDRHFGILLLLTVEEVKTALRKKNSTDLQKNVPVSGTDNFVRMSLPSFLVSFVV